MLDVVTFHKSLKKSKFVKRVFSIVNDRQIISTGLFPVSKKKLSVKDPESFNTSIKKILDCLARSMRIMLSYAFIVNGFSHRTCLLFLIA